MTPFLRLLPVIALASGLAPMAILYSSRHLTHLRAGGEGPLFSPEFIRHLAIAGVLTVLVAGGIMLLARRLSGLASAMEAHQDSWLAGLSAKKLAAVIVLSAGLSLFLELALIRWQISIYPALAFYKNFSLLACFAGIGLGYALAGQRTISMVFVIPLVLWQVLAQGVLVYGLSDAQGVSLHASPITEQLDIGLNSARTRVQILAIYVVLGALFLQTAACLIPIGQLCGKAMARTGNLRAYGLNLVGSVLGTLLMLLMGYLWTGPVIWFALAFAGVLVLMAGSGTATRYATVAALGVLTFLGWQHDVGIHAIHSPYQMIERVTREDGLMTIRVAGRFYQRVYDLRPEHVAHLDDAWTRGESDYYNLPYALAPQAKRVAIVGAGSGNDVAGALRTDVESVDAVEIDPVIVALGRQNHPERPFDDPRVTAIVNDARSHFRATDNTYDLIIYGLLDSHSALSHAANVRVDSFVYTVEGFAEARACLNENGLLLLSFVNLGDTVLGRKIYRMLEIAFDGRAPKALFSEESQRYIFLHSDGPLAISEAVYAAAGYHDVSANFAEGDGSLALSTDDWPFFYMPKRVYPVSYLGMIAAVALMTLLMTAFLLPGRPRRNHLGFFLLGTGFMLVETKAITELGLVFGNTWQVISFVICGVLLMSLVANIAVALRKPERYLIPGILLFVSLAAGYFIAAYWGFQSDTTGKVVAILVLTLPMLFSGILFAALLRTDASVSGGLAANVFGAMCGGLLEYNAMKFGYQSLYLLAAVVYLLALLSMRKKGSAAQTAA
jgi:hypothetical protein